MDATSSIKRLFQTLIYSSIQRCRTSENLCRLSIAIKCFRTSNPPSLRFSISDTGVGSDLVEFLELDAGMVSDLSDRWDGMLMITTTGIESQHINNFQLNIREPAISKSRLNKLPSICKNHRKFSGTEVCFSTKEDNKDIDHFLAWVFTYVQKMLILKTPNVAVEVLVEHIDNYGTRHDRLIQETEDLNLLSSMPIVERMLYGLQSYALKHINAAEKECQHCLTTSEHLKIGTGVASKGSGEIVEVVVIITTKSSQPCCGLNSSFSQVMSFQDFAPYSISKQSTDALGKIDWQSYGLRFKGSIVDDDGNAVLEWDDMPTFAQIDIALHSYHTKVQGTKPRKQAPYERNLIKKAVKMALVDLKEKNKSLFLSSHAQKILQYVPDLSRAVAGLIMSSDDSDFQGECAVLLGLDPVNASMEGMVETCIREKISKVIENNDGRNKVDGESAPILFQCEGQLEEEHRVGGDEVAEDVIMLEL